MNVFQVYDQHNGYMFIAAETPSAAKINYVTTWGDASDAFEAGAGLRCHLIEKDVEFAAGEVTLEYERSRGTDLILSGVIEPCWFLGSEDSQFYNEDGLSADDDDYRQYKEWAGTGQPAWRSGREQVFATIGAN